MHVPQSSSDSTVIDGIAFLINGIKKSHIALVCDEKTKIVMKIESNDIRKRVGQKNIFTRRNVIEK